MPNLAVCFVAILPLEQNFDFFGEQMQYYLGLYLGELLAVTLAKCVVSGASLCGS
jgi:Ca2+:H+ antiporter